jgi:hypothetical protein
MTDLERDDDLGVGEAVQHVQQVPVALGRNVVAAERVASCCIKSGRDCSRSGYALSSRSAHHPAQPLAAGDGPKMSSGANSWQMGMMTRWKA